MEWVLLFMAVFLLVFNLDEDYGRTSPSVTDDAEAMIARQVQLAEESIANLTDEAVLAMLDEVRAWKPGGRP
jgi:hypothetical protein